MSGLPDMDEEIPEELELRLTQRRSMMELKHVNSILANPSSFYHLMMLEGKDEGEMREYWNNLKKRRETLREQLEMVIHPSRGDGKK